MHIVEISLTVNGDGNIMLPQTLLSDMGIKAGEQINIAYITNDNNLLLNTYKEFLITPDGITAVDDSLDIGTIYIPDQIMDAAGISQDSDVVIECERGEIRIMAEGFTTTSKDDPAEEMYQIVGAIKSINLVLAQAINLNNT